MSNHTIVTIDWTSSATGSCSGMFWNTSVTQVSARFTQFVDVDCSATTIGTGVEVPLLMRPLSTKTFNVNVLVNGTTAKACTLSILADGTLTLSGVAVNDVITKASWGVLYDIV